MNLNKYKFLLFDLDDTLLDFKKAEENAFKKLLETHSLDFSKELFTKYKSINSTLWKKFELGEITNKEVVTTRFSLFFSSLEIKVDGSECDKKYRNFLTEGNQLFNGVYDLLTKLKKDYILCIVSNGIATTQYTRMKNSDITDFFSKIYISEEVGAKKPQKQFFDKFFLDFNIKNKSEVLIIGDNLHADILGGFNANIDTCWINPNKEINTLDKEPTYVISSVLDLI